MAWCLSNFFKGQPKACCPLPSRQTSPCRGKEEELARRPSLDGCEQPLPHCLREGGSLLRLASKPGNLKHTGTISQSRLITTSLWPRFRTTHDPNRGPSIPLLPIMEVIQPFKMMVFLDSHIFAVRCRSVVLTLMDSIGCHWLQAAQLVVPLIWTQLFSGTLFPFCFLVAPPLQTVFPKQSSLFLAGSLNNRVWSMTSKRPPVLHVIRWRRGEFRVGALREGAAECGAAEEPGAGQGGLFLCWFSRCQVPFLLPFLFLGRVPY